MAKKKIVRKPKKKVKEVKKEATETTGEEVPGPQQPSLAELFSMFLGLILGEFIVGGFWTLIGTFMGVPTYAFWI